MIMGDRSDEPTLREFVAWKIAAVICFLMLYVSRGNWFVSSPFVTEKSIVWQTRRYSRFWGAVCSEVAGWIR